MRIKKKSTKNFKNDYNDNDKNNDNRIIILYNKSALQKTIATA